MRSAIATSLMRMIPVEMQSKLMLVTKANNEINIQGVFRVEDEFMCVRGRLAGTTDTGRVLFIPFEQIDYMGFRDEVKEPELQAMFAGTYQAPAKAAVADDAEAAAAAATGEAATAPAPAAPAPAPAPAGRPTPVPAPAVPAGSPTPSGGVPSMQPSLPGKAALLERLRKSRLAQDPNKPG